MFTESEITAKQHGYK